MNAWICLLIGMFLGGAISDIVLAVRIYRIYKDQQKRLWPGAGFWMMWKLPVILRSARARLTNIHAAAGLFPRANKNNETLEFVDLVFEISSLSKPKEPPCQKN